MQLGPSNINQIVVSPNRSRDFYVLTKDLVVENLILPHLKVKTAHNRKSNCHEKTMNYRKITEKIKIIPPKPCLVPNN